MSEGFFFNVWLLKLSSLKKKSHNILIQDSLHFLVVLLLLKSIFTVLMCFSGQSGHFCFSLSTMWFSNNGGKGFTVRLEQRMGTFHTVSIHVVDQL